MKLEVIGPNLENYGWRLDAEDRTRYDGLGLEAEDRTRSGGLGMKAEDRTKFGADSKSYLQALGSWPTPQEPRMVTGRCFCSSSIYLGDGDVVRCGARSEGCQQSQL